MVCTAEAAEVDACRLLGFFSHFLPPLCHLIERQLVPERLQWNE